MKDKPQATQHDKELRGGIIPSLVQSGPLTYLYQNFPLRTETVCLHPSSFQRTSSQLEFHTMQSL